MSGSPVMFWGKKVGVDPYYSRIYSYDPSTGFNLEETLDDDTYYYNYYNVPCISKNGNYIVFFIKHVPTSKHHFMRINKETFEYDVVEAVFASSEEDEDYTYCALAPTDDEDVYIGFIASDEPTLTTKYEVLKINFATGSCEVVEEIPITSPASPASFYTHMPRFIGWKSNGNLLFGNCQSDYPGVANKLLKEYEIDRDDYSFKNVKSVYTTFAEFGAIHDETAKKTFFFISTGGSSGFFLNLSEDSDVPIATSRSLASLFPMTEFTYFTAPLALKLSENRVLFGGHATPLETGHGNAMACIIDFSGALPVREECHLWSIGGGFSTSLIDIAKLQNGNFIGKSGEKILEIILGNNDDLVPLHDIPDVTGGVSADIGDVILQIDPIDHKPRNLVGEAHYNENYLTWQAPPEVDGLSAYVIYRDGVQIATTSPSTLEYIDSGVVNGTEYEYTIRGLYVEEGVDSDVVLVTSYGPEISTSIGQVQPLIAIEGRGYRDIAKPLDWETFKDSFSTERYEFTQNKMNIKLVKVGELAEFSLVIHNDDLTLSDTFQCKPVITKRSGWLDYFYFNGVQKAVPYEMPAYPQSKNVVDVKIKAPASLRAGEIASIVFIAQSLDSIGSWDYIDSVLCVAVAPIVTYSDVQKRIEHLLSSEALFPDYSTFSPQTVAENFIDRETELVIKDVPERLTGIQIDELDKFKEYICARVIYKLVERMAQLSVDGGAHFTPTLQTLENEIARLWYMIQEGSP